VRKKSKEMKSPINVIEEVKQEEKAEIQQPQPVVKVDIPMQSEKPTPPKVFKPGSIGAMD